MSFEFLAKPIDLICQESYNDFFENRSLIAPEFIQSTLCHDPDKMDWMCLWVSNLRWWGANMKDVLTKNKDTHWLGINLQWVTNLLISCTSPPPANPFSFDSPLIHHLAHAFGRGVSKQVNKPWGLRMEAINNSRMTDMGGRGGERVRKKTEMLISGNQQ